MIVARGGLRTRGVLLATLESDVAYMGVDRRCMARSPSKGEPAKRSFEGLSMTSSQSRAVTTAFGLGLVFVPVAWAGSTTLADARSALYSMINAKDKSAQDTLNVKVQAASTKLDSVLASMTGADAKVATDFKAVWDQFKATRENEIIPAIYKGNTAEAKKITDGIQYERLSKMWSIMSCR